MQIPGTVRPVSLEDYEANHMHRATKITVIAMRENTEAITKQGEAIVAALGLISARLDASARDNIISLEEVAAAVAANRAA